MNFLNKHLKQIKMKGFFQRCFASDYSKVCVHVFKKMNNKNLFDNEKKDFSLNNKI